MGNSASLYDVRLDGEAVTNLPKSLYEPLQMLMNGHQSLIILRKPDIVERSMDINDNSIAAQEIVDQITDMMTERQKQITDAFNASINVLNNQVAEMKYTINTSNARQPIDTTALKTTIDLLAGRFNDIANNLPSTLTEKFNNQTNQMIDAFNEILHPKDSINASIKGAQYELDVIQGLESLNAPELSIERVSTEAAVCDIHVIDTNNDILYAFECKNYGKTVGKKEIDKFYRDLGNLKDIYGSRYKAIIGIFLSKQTNIVGHGALDFDKDGNVFLASEFNNPLMWRALMVYFAKVKKVESVKPTTCEDHLRIILAAYNAMRDTEPLAELITKNINRLNDSIKDLKVMSEKLKPISDIIDQYAMMFGLSVPEKKSAETKKVKAKKSKKSDKEETIDETDGDTEQENNMAESDDEIVVVQKPKRKYIKRQIINTEPTLVTQARNNHSSAGWSDDD